MTSLAADRPTRLRRSPAPRLPRRVSGHPRSRVVTEDAPLAIRGQRTLSRVLSGRSLDAIIERRLWIPGLAVLLIGIVGLQVVTLGVNAGIGRTVERSGELQRENTLLSADVSRLESSGRLTDAVGGMGLVDPVAGSTHYLHAGGAVADRAAANQIARVAADPSSLPPLTLTAAGTDPDAARGRRTARSGSARDRRRACADSRSHAGADGRSGADPDSRAGDGSRRHADPAATAATPTQTPAATGGQAAVAAAAVAAPTATAGIR